MRGFVCQVLVAFVLLSAVPAQAEHVAGDLRDFVTDLYGGDGITLPPAPGIPGFIADAHVPHFTGEQQILALSALSDGILSGSGLYALNSTVTGISFDLSTGLPQAVQEGLGPLLSERATTVGKGRFTLGFGFTKQKFTELDGEDLSNITIPLTHQDCCVVGPPSIPPPDGQKTGFEEDLILLTIDLDVEQDVYALYGNFGMTDTLDFGIVVPVIRAKATAFAVAEIFPNPDGGSTINGNPIHSFEVDPLRSLSDTGGTETGLGDILLRGKWHFLNDTESFADMALRLDVTLPSGDEKKLLGTGETQFRGIYIISKQIGKMTPHLNVGYTVATSDKNLEKLTYAVGFDARLSNKFTFATDVIGRYNPHLKEIGNHVIDLALAVKWNPFSQRNMPLNAFVSIPLNDDGLRADFVWGLGFDVILN
jgi:hypothetical protein